MKSTFFMKRIFIFCLVAAGMSFTAPAQLVNIESARMQSDTTGWMGDANASMGIAQSVDHQFKFQAGAHLQYKNKTNKDLWLLLSNYSYEKDAAKQFSNNAFGHLRYNHKLNAWLRWEVFAQAQNNLITQVRSRILIGTGPRFKLLSTKIIRLYIASLVMHEKEKEDTHPFIKHNDWRNSSYISFTITPEKNIEFISTTYYQPLFRKISDFRVLNEATLKVKASKHFALSADWEFLHDRFPAGTAPRTTYSFGSGLNFSF
jgi:Protein of unknown function, DUF481